MKKIRLACEYQERIKRWGNEPDLFFGLVLGALQLSGAALPALLFLPSSLLGIKLGLLGAPVGVLSFGHLLVVRILWTKRSAGRKVMKLNRKTCG